MDIGMVVSDMDGTLLLDDGTVPEGFWPLLDAMVERGIAFVPASGRQLATLGRLFDGRGADGALSFIAENGTLVTHADEVVSTTTVTDEFARTVVDAVRAAGQDGADLGVVVCRTDGAVIERVDEPFAAECAKYYVQLDQVDDLLEHCRDVLKLAVFDFGDAADSAQRYFGGLDQQVVVSGKHWIDIMDRDANKGHGVRALQQVLGVTAAQTVAFGDYLNDVEMLGAADHSYAVANAHPDVASVAARSIPSNVEQGVVRELARLLRKR